MCVIGLFEGEGTSCADLKVRQYLCSGVSGDGPLGSFNDCKGATGAAIVSDFFLRLCFCEIGVKFLSDRLDYFSARLALLAASN